MKLFIVLSFVVLVACDLTSQDVTCQLFQRAQDVVIYDLQHRILRDRKIGVWSTNHQTTYRGYGYGYTISMINHNPQFEIMRDCIYSQIEPVQHNCPTINCTGLEEWLMEIPDHLTMCASAVGFGNLHEDITSNIFNNFFRRLRAKYNSECVGPFPTPTPPPTPCPPPAPPCPEPEITPEECDTAVYNAVSQASLHYQDIILKMNTTQNVTPETVTQSCAVEIVLFVILLLGSWVVVCIYCVFVRCRKRSEATRPVESTPPPSYRSMHPPDRRQSVDTTSTESDYTSSS